MAAGNGKDKKENKKKFDTVDGDLQTTASPGRAARAKSAVSSGATRIASTVSNNKKGFTLGTVAAAAAAAGVLAVVKRRRSAAALSGATETVTPEAPAEKSLHALDTPAPENTF